MDKQAIAEKIYKAEKEGYQIEMPSIGAPEMTIRDAYEIQRINIAKKLAEGEHLIGMKIGLTSKGMQKLVGVTEPDLGHLTDAMMMPEGQDYKVSDYIQPKVEGELAFLLKKTLKGPGITAAHVYDACEYVLPALEIVDSRIKDWKVTIVDTIADNGSSAGLVLGSCVKPIGQVDMRLTGMNFEKNGELLSSATTAEVMGNPVNAVAWLANALADFDMELSAGSIVLAGALTAATPVKAGDTVSASFAGMGSVSVRFV